MKRSEQVKHFRSLDLAGLKAEIQTLQKQIQEQKVALAFGKSKQVRTLRNHKRALAQSLTIANQKLRQQIDTPVSEK